MQGGDDGIEARRWGEEHRPHGGVVSAQLGQPGFGRHETQRAGNRRFEVGPTGREEPAFVEADAFQQV